MSIDKKLTFGEIWKVLAKEDVSKYTQEKGKLTYLSWARAWILLMKHHSESEYTFHDFDGLPFRTLPDGTAEVVTSLNIGGCVRSMTSSQKVKSQQPKRPRKRSRQSQTCQRPKKWNL